MFYAYILESIAKPGTYYRGHATDLKTRLAEHNSAKCSSTAALRPWMIKFYAAFGSLHHAQECERYLKTGSGHAFAKKHLRLDTPSPVRSIPPKE
jgi:putative endonuclease